MEGRVHSTPPFIMLARNEHGGMPHGNTRTKRTCIVAPQKKKGIVEASDCTKRARKLIQRPHRRRRSDNHNSRIAEATELDWFVKCGMYALANSWAEVGFHSGVTTSYALTELWFFGGSALNVQRSTFATSSMSAHAAII